MYIMDSQVTIKLINYLNELEMRAPCHKNLTNSALVFGHGKLFNDIAHREKTLSIMNLWHSTLLLSPSICTRSIIHKIQTNNKIK